MDLYILSSSLGEFVSDALDIHLSDMVVQIASTIFLVVIVKVFLWERVTEFLDSRKEMMDKDINASKEMLKEAEQLKEQANGELLTVKKEAVTIIADAKLRAEENKVRIEAKARKEASQIIDNAHKEVEVELEKARKEIKDEIVDVAMVIAEKVVEKEIDKKKHNKIIEEVMNEVIN